MFRLSLSTNHATKIKEDTSSTIHDPTTQQVTPKIDPTNPKSNGKDGVHQSLVQKKTTEKGKKIRNDTSKSTHKISQTHKSISMLITGHY